MIVPCALVVNCLLGPNRLQLVHLIQLFEDEASHKFLKETKRRVGLFRQLFLHTHQELEQKSAEVDLTQ